MATENLVQMIETLVQEKTFSLDALEAIKNLRDKAEKLQDELEKTQRTLADTQSRRSALTAENALLTEELNVWKNRESAILSREKTMYALEQRTAVAEAQANAFLLSMKITFAPNMVRNSLQDFSTRNQNGNHTDYSRNINQSETETVSSNQSRTDTRVEGYARPGDQDAGGGVGTQPSNTL